MYPYEGYMGDSKGGSVVKLIHKASFSLRICTVPGLIRGWPGWSIRGPTVGPKKLERHVGFQHAITLRVHN